MKTMRNVVGAQSEHKDRLVNELTAMSPEELKLRILSQLKHRGITVFEYEFFSQLLSRRTRDTLDATIAELKVAVDEWCGKRDVS